MARIHFQDNRRRILCGVLDGGRAVEAAVEIQRRLGRENFSNVDGLAVRMAIHVGEADERDGDYFGAAVNRAARLLSAGHGGQILLSGVAADLCWPSLPSGVTLRHLGALPLRDLKEPERVYQPVGSGLRSDFKPLRALETPPNNLPHQSHELRWPPRRSRTYRSTA